MTNHPDQPGPYRPGPYQPGPYQPGPYPPRHAHRPARPTRPWWRRKRIAFLALIAVLVVLGAANRDTAPTTPPTSTSTTSSTRTTTPTRTITAVELIAAFDENQIAAEKAWRGAHVRVTGRVINVSDDILGQRYIGIGTTGPVTLSSIRCGLADPADALKVKNRATHTVTGTVKDQTLGVIELTGCRVVR